MMKILGVASALFLSLASIGARADMVEIADEVRAPAIDLDQVDAVVIPEGPASRVFMRADQVDGDAVVLSQEELSNHLNAVGVDAVSADARTWGRPWVEVVAGVGLPNLLNARAEVRVSDQWAVGIGGGVGLLPSAGEVTARFTPGWACWGCGRRVQGSLSFGPDVVVMPEQGRVAVILAGAIEAEVVAWLAHGFGLTLGTRWGIGGTREFGPNHYTNRIEPALSVVLLQVGAVFGERHH